MVRPLQEHLVIYSPPTYRPFLFLKTWARPLSISECVRH